VVRVRMVWMVVTTMTRNGKQSAAGPGEDYQCRPAHGDEVQRFWNRPLFLEYIAFTYLITIPGKCLR
jgi:hypothetical protein